MVILKSDRKREENAIRALHSRFEYEWSRLSPLRAVIFDMDGTLVNSMSLHLRAWREAFLAAKVSIDEEEFKRDVYRLEGLKAEQTDHVLFIKYKGKEPKKRLVQKIVDDKKQLHLQLAASAKPFKGVLKILDLLKSLGVPLAVVTGTPREVAESTVERHFPGRFRVIVSESDVTKGKPDALPFLTAAKQLQIGNRDQCLAVENAPLGVQAAVAAGIPVYSILMNSPLEPSDLRNAGANRVFFSYAELLPAISELRFRELRLPNKRLQKERDNQKRSSVESIS